MVIKKAMLTGHPFKIHKKSAVIRYMFFDRGKVCCSHIDPSHAINSNAWMYEFNVVILQNLEMTMADPVGRIEPYRTANCILNAWERLATLNTVAGLAVTQQS